MPSSALSVPFARSAAFARGTLPGVLLTAGLAFIALAASRTGWCEEHGLSALTIAIVLGIALGNTVFGRVAVRCTRGVNFSKQRLLRIGIVLYGLRLTFQDIGGVGLHGVVIDAVVLCSTFGLAWWAGTRLFGLDRETAMLIGAGSAICGAAAVMAAEPVVRGRADQVVVAISTVVVFGTIAVFAYPPLYHLLQQQDWFVMSSHGWGLFTGSTVHEVAQVVAAGRAIDGATADTAVIAKMVRVMMLAPFLIALSAWLSRAPTRDGAPSSRATRVVVPWFALGFVAMTGFNSLQLLPAEVVAVAIDVDTFLLAMAMAALGLTTHVSALRRAGIRPLGLATLLFVWLVAGGLAVNAGVTWLLK